MSLADEVLISNVIKKQSGKWNYTPYGSDTALDFAWHLEIDLLKRMLKIDSIEENMVILDLLSHIKNNSIDEVKNLWKRVKEKIKPEIQEWAKPHKDKSEARKTLVDLMNKVENRIIHGEYRRL